MCLLYQHSLLALAFPRPREVCLLCSKNMSPWFLFFKETEQSQALQGRSVMYNYTTEHSLAWCILALGATWRLLCKCFWIQHELSLFVVCTGYIQWVNSITREDGWLQTRLVSQSPGLLNCHLFLFFSPVPLNRPRMHRGMIKFVETFLDIS